MECNRDDAVRAKEIAERKFLAKDMKGAKKFALKVQNLFPELDGIAQMLMTLEVYISAEEDKRNGESNWYGVLGVTPLADDETIRRQYRKLALMLHPDKNRSVGAEGAFQLVSQAWSLLSDRSKRTAYDQRHRTAFQQRNQTAKEGPSRNGLYNFANTSSSQMKAPNGNVGNKNSTSGSNPARKKERRTFWTVCHRCKMQYEYLRMYLNHNLLCPNCHEAYFAFEIDPPSTKVSKTSSSHTSNSHRWKNTSQQGSDAARNNSGTQHGNSGSNRGNESNKDNFQWVPFTESTGAQSSVKVQAANMVQQAYEKVKRERQKAQAAARREEALRRKKFSTKRPMAADSSGRSDLAKRSKGVEDCGANKEKMKQMNFVSESVHQANFSDLKRDRFQKCTSKRGSVFHMDIKHLLMEKAREEIDEKRNERMPATMVKNVAGEEVLETIKENETANVKNGRLKSVEEERKLVEQMSVDVLDSDFHNFDKDRTEKCFRDNQVWAVYDDRDGMPRHYAMIRNVISINPFKVRMSWLSSISLLLSRFSKSCGEFRTGRVEICNSTEWFSHNVRCMKQTSKTVQIFPRKGDVWALYRNWSPEWNELTADKVMNKYDMVEVLEDYDEELGVIAIPLLKVAGFKAVFHQHLDPTEIRRIPKEEMSRFSHQVPSHLLTGQEGSKSVKGCRELDTAAIPLHFIDVMSNIEEIEFMAIDDEDVEFVKAVDCEGNTITDKVEGIS